MQQASSIALGTTRADLAGFAMEQYLQWNQMKRTHNFFPHGTSFIPTWLLRYNIIERMGVARPPFSALIVLLNQYQDIPLVNQFIFPELMAMKNRALDLDRHALYSYCEQLISWEEEI
ncbi:uncharacterized protein N7479_009468 [Penicillium vulpinum]|uniref:Uncharacterized protein n=1 Tax=Penicillium vulpinum TaxID=29845 RepID=A0A1V6RAN5_9EURO|nr:uncharacterized protein N7479_009468 [Penicillium vulpinum]KAJ5951055.1 hypothetical protein N7479_009468 [Penicillium vulpinum]OQD98618.1 hypothetical protein PENVUL_c069G10048 [Penicillium vulpinum]